MSSPKRMSLRLRSRSQEPSSMCRKFSKTSSPLRSVENWTTSKASHIFCERNCPCISAQCDRLVKEEACTRYERRLKGYFFTWARPRCHLVCRHGLYVPAAFGCSTSVSL